MLGARSVLVVGAGPAGAASALLLARNGIEVTLLERERDFARVFRGEGLMPSGVDALAQMGLLLDSLPGRWLEGWDLYFDGVPIFSIEEPREPEAGGLRIVPQPALLEAIVAEAQKQPSFTFERGATLRELRREADRVVGARVQTSEGMRELRADLVLGCDGRASAVRKRAALELALLPEGWDVLWFKLPAPEHLRRRCRFAVFLSQRQRAACYTSWDERLQVALVLPKGGYAQQRGMDWSEQIAGAVTEELAQHVRSERDALEGPVLLDVIVGRAQCWSAPGLLLLGDAAHPMSPIRAQGINLALRDAIVAANHLVPALRAGSSMEAIDAAAGEVQRDREPEVARAQKLQHRETSGWQALATPLLLFVARHLGSRLGSPRWAQRAWLALQHDLRFGSTEVRLEV